MPQFLLLITPKQPQLTSTQIQTLIQIAIEVGVIGAAAVTLPTLFDRGSFIVIFLGSVITLGAWWFAVWLSKKIT